MRLPWKRTENRQQEPVTGSGGYTDAIVQAILSAAAGGDTLASPLVTSALEGCASIYAAAFASARIRGAGRMVRPATMAAIARDLVRHGDSVWLIHSDESRRPPRLLHADSWDVQGSFDPMRWRYQVSIAAPNGRAYARRVPAEQVVHAMYAHDRNQPWLGVAPLQWASATGRLLAIVERVLSDESSGTRGYLLPIPAGGGDDEVDALKADLAALAGRTSLVETTSGGWGTGRADAPTSDWMPKRIGPNYPAQVVGLRMDVQNAVAVACGVPLGLVGGGDASALRESWRLFLHGSVAPLARLVTDELSMKLDREVTADFTELYAADVQGRARAFQSMTGGGMDAARAAELSGLT